MDIFTAEKRSAVMSAIRGRNTEPERIVGQILHAIGVAYRRHLRQLPGRPDFLLRHERRIVVFVHGCFWHQHRGCPAGHLPASNRAFWESKLKRNSERDAEVARVLRKLGYAIVTVWECELSRPGTVASRLKRRLRYRGGETRKLRANV